VTRLCEPTEFLDHSSPAVQEFLARTLADRDRPATELAVDLYYAVRDGIRYEIYGIDFSRAAMRASAVVESGRGLCIHKSILYAACTRALGIPSRLAFADVRNHVASPRLKRFLGGDVVHYHCFTRLYLQKRWVSATPVFSAPLCRLYRIAPLDFDGTSDAVLQPYDELGRSHMEFVRELRSAHPRLFEGTRVRSGSLVTEAAR
jgi:transglutaminase-like putative cysteine protease